MVFCVCWAKPLVPPAGRTLSKQLFQRLQEPLFAPRWRHVNRDATSPSCRRPRLNYTVNQCRVLLKKNEAKNKYRPPNLCSSPKLWLHLYRTLRNPQKNGAREIWNISFDGAIQNIKGCFSIWIFHCVQTSCNTQWSCSDTVGTGWCSQTIQTTATMHLFSVADEVKQTDVPCPGSYLMGCKWCWFWWWFLLALWGCWNVNKCSSFWGGACI